MYRIDNYVDNVLTISIYYPDEQAFVVYEDMLSLRDNSELVIVECEPVYLVPVHMCPAEGEWDMPCCNRSPHEMLSHRMTIDPTLVTCKGRGM